MGCDIHPIAQVRADGVWRDVPINGFDDRNYGLFAWLVGVRNYSGVKPTSEPRGLPDDVDDALHDYMSGYHSVSWISAAELAAVDYGATIEDRRCTGQLPNGMTSGALTCEPGYGEKMPLRDFLGSYAMDGINEIIGLGDARLLFGFDS